MSVNGQYSEWFGVKRGNRQGDPLSHYLFLICAEILSLILQKNKSINGVKIFEEEILLSQFANDTTFFSKADKNHFKPVYIAAVCFNV